MKPLFITIQLVAGMLALTGSTAQEKGKEPISEELVAAFRAKEFDKVIQLSESHQQDEAWLQARAAAFQERGIERFFAANIDGSIRDFDEYLKIYPKRDPNHWQRGIAYYYSGEYEKGVAQFERHQTVNSHDVENAVWHFLCVVRAPKGDFKAAQKLLIPIEGDSRVPMKEVHELFAGRGSVDDVLKAAGAGEKKGAELTEMERNNLCYAHLYLALYFEALGKTEKMAEHIQLAAGKFRMDHYMGKVAQVHAKLRGIKIPVKSKL